MDHKPTVTARLVALAWVRGSINNAIVRALLGGCTSTRAGSAICCAKDAGHLVETKATLPKAWGLSPERAAAIASMPDLLALRTEAEQLAQVAQRVGEAQAAMREQRTDQRKAALASAAIHNRQARSDARQAGRRVAKVARAAAKAAAKAGAIGLARRPPSPPGASRHGAGPSPPGHAGTGPGSTACHCPGAGAWRPPGPARWPLHPPRRPGSPGRAVPPGRCAGGPPAAAQRPLTESPR